MSSLFNAISCMADYDPEALPVQRAQAAIQSLITPISGAERVFIRNALGRVLSEDIISPINVPAYDNSAMDGYAMRHADLSANAATQLRIAGTALAGQPYAGSLQAGECARIMTGAVIPNGADTVVMQENVALEGHGTIALIPAGQQLDQNIRRAGEDLGIGQTALAQGKLLRPAEIGLLASLGLVEINVYRRLRVAIFSTGDELNALGHALPPGGIYDSNRYSLSALLTRLGCEVLDMGAIADDPALIESALRKAAANADVIITSGGVSVGEADFIKQLMDKLGEVAFWKIAMKPGRPLAFGKVQGTWLFGLPGNPVAVMVAFYQFVRPALLHMSGVSPVEPLPTFPVRCASKIRKGKGRTEFQRGILFHADGEWQVRTTGAQGSGMLSSMAAANCFIVLGEGQGNVEVGDMVMVQLMEGLI